MEDYNEILENLKKIRDGEKIEIADFYKSLDFAIRMIEEEIEWENNPCSSWGGYDNPYDEAYFNQ